MAVRHAAVLICAITLAAAIGGAFAVVPEASVGNLVAFPNRDFITIEGFPDYETQDLLVEVLRKNNNGGEDVIGSAKFLDTSKTLGDVAGEINHPGGACWGQRTDVKVTPDMKPGDRVRITNGAEMSYDTIIQDTYVEGPWAKSADGKTLTISGYIAPGVNQAQLEQRVVNPDLTATSVNRRDIRAVFGPLTPAPKGGYSSMLTVTGTKFTATYVFTDLAVSQGVPDTVMTGGGERMMSWQVEDADANRQGLTITELGEAGGPGMGGCPLGPADAPPPAGKMQVVKSGSSASLEWTPQTAVPGTPAIVAYAISAVKDVTAAPLEKSGFVKILDPKTTKTSLMFDGAASSYTYEVRSLSSDAGSLTNVKYGPAFEEVSPAQTKQPPIGTNNGTVPKELTIDFDTMTGIATFNGIEKSSMNKQLDTYYTFDVNTLDGDSTKYDANRYTAPFKVPAALAGSSHKICWAIFNEQGTQTTAGCGGPYPFPAAAAPQRATPGLVAGIGGPLQITARWTYDASDAGLTSFTLDVKEKDALDSTAKSTTGIAKDQRSLVATGLKAATKYVFRVTPVPTVPAGAGTAWSAPVSTDDFDKVTITPGLWKSDDFRITVACPTSTNTIKVYSGNAAAPGRLIWTFLPAGSPTTNANGATPGSGPLTAVAAPGIGFDGQIRLRGTVQAGTSNPGKIWAVWAGGLASTSAPVAAKGNGRKLSLRRL